MLRFNWPLWLLAVFMQLHRADGVAIVINRDAIEAMWPATAGGRFGPPHCGQDCTFLKFGSQTQLYVRESIAEIMKMKALDCDGHC